MRPIPDKASDPVAGGYDGLSATIGGDTGGGARGEGAGFGGASGDTTVPASQTPLDIPSAGEKPPDTRTHMSALPPGVPAGVNMDQLRHVATITGDKIKLYADQSVEYGAMIIKYPDGIIGSTAIEKGLPGEVSMSYRPKPGEKIVAYIHSHPYDDYIDQRLPSRDDFHNAAELRQHPAVDHHLLMYIVDLESGDVYEYHSGQDSSTRKVGANISKDLRP